MKDEMQAGIPIEQALRDWGKALRIGYVNALIKRIDKFLLDNISEIDVGKETTIDELASDFLLQYYGQEQEDDEANKD